MKWSIPFAIFLLALVSCKKEKDDYSFAASRGVTSGYSLLSATVPTILAVENHLSTGASLPFCATLDVLEGDTSTFPLQEDTVIVDLIYSPGCTDFDGRDKAGKIRITYYPDSANLDYIITYSNYEVANYILNGSIVVNAQFLSQYNYYMLSPEFKVRRQEGNDVNVLFKIDTRVFYGGTSGMKLNIAEVEGRDLNGKSFTFKSMSDLVLLAGCIYPVSGSMELQLSDFEARNIQFGSGDCDANVRITSGSTSLLFQVP